MKILCTICARGGSKGVANKNLRPLLDKPLIAHSISQAKQTGLFDLVAVSSDSLAILETAKAFGADICILRPAELASDTAAKMPVIQHAARSVEELTGKTFDVFVDLDCTSPLRLVDDILGAVNLFLSQKCDNVITGARARRSPYFNLVEMGPDETVKLSKQLAEPIVRRQDSPRCFDMNASIYVWSREALMVQGKVFLSRTLLYEMPEERSIDVDSELDFSLVELLAQKRGCL